MVKLIAGDVVESLLKLDSGSVDLIITSPPYNVHFDYGVYDDFMPWPEYYDWCRQWLRQCNRVLAEDGRMLLMHYFSIGNKEDGRHTPLMTLSSVCWQMGLQHHAVIIWEDRTVSKLTAWGSWLKATSPYVNSPYEGILVMYKNRWKKDRKGVTKISKEEFIEGCSGIWKIPATKGARRVHPAPFPLKLAERGVLLFSQEGDTVLDPFAGSCTALVAADRHNRDGIGIDLNPEYIEAGREWVIEDREARGE